MPPHLLTISSRPSSSMGMTTVQSLVFLSFYIYRLYFIHRYAGIVREALAAIAADKKDVPYFHEQRVAAYIEEGQTGDFIPREIYLFIYRASAMSDESTVVLYIRTRRSIIQRTVHNSLYESNILILGTFHIVTSVTEVHESGIDIQSDLRESEIRDTH